VVFFVIFEKNLRKKLYLVRFLSKNNYRTFTRALPGGLVILIKTFVTGAVAASVSMAALSGTVTDSLGAAVPGALVKLEIGPSRICAQPSITMPRQFSIYPQIRPGIPASIRKPEPTAATTTRRVRIV
jgi:hypothetical protein